MAIATDKTTAKVKEVDEAPAKKKSKKKLIIIAVVSLLVVVVAYKEVLAPKKKPVAGAAVPPPKPGPIVTPDAVTINLTGGHYLRIGIALEFTTKVSATTPPDGSAALDQTISYLTGQSPATLETPTGFATVKAALTTRIAAAYPTDPMLGVLITSFVIQ